MFSHKYNNKLLWKCICQILGLDLALTKAVSNVSTNIFISLVSIWSNLVWLMSLGLTRTAWHACIHPVSIIVPGQTRGTLHGYWLLLFSGSPKKAHQLPGSCRHSYTGWSKLTLNYTIRYTAMLSARCQEAVSLADCPRVRDRNRPIVGSFYL